MSDAPENLQVELGYHFRDPQLLVQALTHPSFAAEQRPPAPDNQRLEFLGDAVLHFATAEILFQRFPDLAEGELTKIRSALTKESTLASFARTLELGACLRLGKGEKSSGGQERPSNLADAFEAVLGAMDLDGGLAAIQTLLRRLIADSLDDVEDVLATENPKGALQELAQELHQTTPAYRVIRVSGPEHRPEFEVGVTIDETEIATAVAGSRRAAEQKAAEAALQRLTDDD